MMVRSWLASLTSKQDIWLEAVLEYLRKYEKKLARTLQDGYAEKVVQTTIKGIESVWTTEDMLQIQGKLQISAASMEVIRITLSRTFDDATLRWVPKDVPGLEKLGLSRTFVMPQLPSQTKVNTLRRKLRKELGLEFSADGNLATIEVRG